MNKKIIITACIVFALIFVVILAVMMGTISQKGNDANTQLVDTLNSTSNANLDLYKDDSKVKGESVINAIKNVKTLGGDVKMTILVKTKANGTGVEYSESNSYNVTNEYDDNYINPEASFLCEWKENNNGIVTGITFTQQD